MHCGQTSIFLTQYTDRTVLTTAIKGSIRIRTDSTITAGLL